jgi:hypothetical protein
VIDSYLTQVTTGTGVLALSIHDLQQGRLVAEVTLPPERTPYIGIPSKKELVPSSDGTKLHVLLLDAMHGLRVVTVDTQNYQIVQDIQTHQFCDGGWPTPVRQRLVIVCQGQPTTVDLDAKQLSPLPLRTVSDAQSVTRLRPFMASTPSRDQQRVYLVEAGQATTLATVNLTGETRLTEVQLQHPADLVVATSSLMVSPDSARAFVGFRSTRASDNGLSDETPFGAESYADQIGIFDTSTGKPIGWINLATPVVSFTLSRDGRTLYGASPQAHQISVIDVASGQTVTIQSAGTTPALIIPSH